MCRTPITAPSLISGTPSIASIPRSHRMGFVTVSGLTVSSDTGRCSAAIRPAKPWPIGTWTFW